MKIAKQIISLCEAIKVGTSFSSYQKIALESAINFYLKELGVTKVPPITVKSIKQKKTFGDIALNTDGSIQDKFVIKVDPRSFFELFLKQVAHEVTHLKQIVKSELSAGQVEGKMSILWNGKPVISSDEYGSGMDYDVYSKLPFEAEAIEKSKELRDKYIKSDEFQALKGKDPLLDQIIGGMK